MENTDSIAVVHSDMDCYLLDGSARVCVPFCLRGMIQGEGDTLSEALNNANKLKFQVLAATKEFIDQMTKLKGEAEELSN